MSMFYLIGGVMVALALGLVCWPLLQDRSRTGLVTVAIVACLVVGGSAALYAWLGDRSWSQPAEAANGAPHSIDEMVAKLEAKLAANPADVDGWLMLGRSRFVQNDYPRAAQAFEHAYTASKGQNVEAVVSYAEALTVSDQSALAGKAGELFETALGMDPANPKGLWYGGMAQAMKGNYTVAHQRWMTLLGQELPAEIKSMLVDRVRELDQAMGQKKDPELDRIAASTPAAAPAAPATSPSAGAGAGAAPAVGRTIKVHVELAAALQGKVPAGAPLFIIARDPTQPGPPFAAKRLGGVSLPLDVELSEQDAMMAGRSIADAHQLVIVARYSASGQPQQASGDLYGQAPVAGDAHNVRITIDQRAP